MGCLISQSSRPVALQPVAGHRPVVNRGIPLTFAFSPSYLLHLNWTVHPDNFPGNTIFSSQFGFSASASNKKPSEQKLNQDDVVYVLDICTRLCKCLGEHVNLLVLRLTSPRCEPRSAGRLEGRNRECTRVL